MAARKRLEGESYALYKINLKIEEFKTKYSIKGFLIHKSQYKLLALVNAKKEVS